MKILAENNLSSAIYGSVARGDINEHSDIDIILPYVVSSNKVELALRMNGFKIFSRQIAQATPSHTPKAHIFVDAFEKQCIT